MPGFKKVPLPDLTGAVVDMGRFRLEERIGSGAFGYVYRALDLTTPAPHKVYALKCMAQAPMGTRAQLLQDTEINIHSRIPAHKNVVAMKEFFYESELLFMVLEYCERGTLQEALERFELQGNDERIREVLLQIIDGLEHCHKNRVYHRDLKPENVLISADGTVKIADFGLADDDLISDTHFVGTKPFMSPDCLGEESDLSYSLVMNDTWALGVLVAMMVNNDMPWSKAAMSDTMFYNYFLRADHFIQTYLISKEMNELFKRLFPVDLKACTCLSEVRDAVFAMPSFYPAQAQADRGSVSDASSVTLVEAHRFGRRPAAPRRRVRTVPPNRKSVGNSMYVENLDFGANLGPKKPEISDEDLDFAPNVARMAVKVAVRRKRRSIFTRLIRVAFRFGRT